MKRTNRPLFIHNTARGRIKFLLLALFAFQGLQAQKLFPAPSAIETHKGTFSYDEISAKYVRTTISKSLCLPSVQHIRMKHINWKLRRILSSLMPLLRKAHFMPARPSDNWHSTDGAKSAVAGFTVRHATHGADLCSMKAATSSAKRK